MKDEGGYEILLRSLIHYKKRLMVVDKSPEIKDSAAMFGEILRSAAKKTIPEIDEITQKIKQSLPELHQINDLSEKTPILEKALLSYESDIQKAQNSGHEYYLSLVGDLQKAEDDLKMIKVAKLKIKQFE